MQRKINITIITLFLLILLFPIQAANAEGGEAFTQCLQTPFENGCYAGLPATHYQMLLDEMLLNPWPNVRPLPVNETEITRFAFRRLVNPSGTTIYSGPNGQPVGTLAAGFNYVTVEGYEPGWVQINNGQWVMESDTAVTRPSTFAGVLLDRESLEYEMAWVLIPTHPSPNPGAAADQNKPRLDRYTRLNIYETAQVDGWNWYLVGPDMWIQQTMVAKILFTERPAQVKGRWMAVDLYEQVLVAYEGDTPVYATLISSGLPQWSTNEGTFQTWVRLASGAMSGAEGQTDFYSLENVPWTLYFDNSISIHGTYWHDGFGYRHSHGCVNLSLTDSHWVYQWTLDGGYDLPWVHVWSSGEYVTG